MFEDLAKELDAYEADLDANPYKVQELVRGELVTVEVPKTGSLTGFVLWLNTTPNEFLKLREQEPEQVKFCIARLRNRLLQHGKAKEFCHMVARRPLLDLQA